MNSYDLSRAFWNYSFENPDKIKPNHCAVYFMAIEHCNRLGWKEKFGFPTIMVMEAVGIKSFNTYTKILSDLVEFGFIKLIEKSKNQYSSNIVALSNFDEALDEALDKALIKHGSKQEESTIQSIDSIIKQINNKQINNKQINNYQRRVLLNFLTGSKKTDGEKIDVTYPVLELKEKYKKENKIHEIVCDREKISKEFLFEKLDEFTLKLISEGKQSDYWGEYTRYFNNWLPKHKNTKPVRKLEAITRDERLVYFYWEHEGRQSVRTIEKAKAKDYFDNEKKGGYIAKVV